MNIEIPHEVAMFLNFLGVPYPDIDEDQVRELARQVRGFAMNVAGTHESASGSIRQMGSVYSGYSYEQLVAAWARMSAGHMTNLDRACRVVAKALEIAAEVITVIKVAVLAELAALAAGYASMMAATVVTGGTSVALTAAIRTAASRLVSAMEQMLVAYVAAEVIGKAIKPLEDAIEHMINGVVYHAAADLLGVPPSSSSTPQPLHIEPDEVLRYADQLNRYADEIVEHAARFAENVAALDFSTSSGLGDLTVTGPDGTWVPPISSPDPDSAYDPRSHGLPSSPRQLTAPQPSGAVPAGAGGEDPAEPGRPAATESPTQRPAGSGSPGARPETSSPTPTTDDPRSRVSEFTDRLALPGTPVSDDGSPAAAAKPVSAQGTTGELSVSPDGSAADARHAVRHGDAAQGSPAVAAGPDAAGRMPSPAAAAFVDNPAHDATAAQQAPGPAQGKSQTSTPWGRSGQQNNQSAAPAKKARRRPDRPWVAPVAMPRKPVQTPWSKKPQPTAPEPAAAKPTVFAPPATKPGRRSGSPNRRTGSDHITADPAQQRNETTPPNASP